MSSANVARTMIPRGLGCVLLVEDEFLIRMLVADELRDEGYQVIEASNAHEALEVLGGVVPDAIISDVRMPGSIDGMDLLAVVRKSFPNLPMILVSGHAYPEDALAAGATRFMAKPFRLGEVVDTIRDVLNPPT